MDPICRIRRLDSRGKKIEREIARISGLSRNTAAFRCLSSWPSTVPKAAMETSFARSLLLPLTLFSDGLVCVEAAREPAITARITTDTSLI